jgi:hypothetical protein
MVDQRFSLSDLPSLAFRGSLFVVDDNNFFWCVNTSDSSHVYSIVVEEFLVFFVAFLETNSVVNLLLMPPMTKSHASLEYLIAGKLYGYGLATAAASYALSQRSLF